MSLIHNLGSTPTQRFCLVAAYSNSHIDNVHRLDFRLAQAVLLMPGFVHHDPIPHSSATSPPDFCLLLSNSQHRLPLTQTMRLFKEVLQCLKWLIWPFSESDISGNKDPVNHICYCLTVISTGVDRSALRKIQTNWVIGKKNYFFSTIMSFWGLNLGHAPGL